MPVATLDPPLPLNLAVYEQSSGSIWLALLDGDMQPFSPLLLSSLTLTLYTIDANGQLTIVNGRSNQNVLNTNGVTLFGNIQSINGRPYNVRWNFGTLDTTPVDDRVWLRYLARFTWQWTGGVGQQELAIIVQRVRPIVSNVSNGDEGYFASNYFGAPVFGG